MMLILAVTSWSILVAGSFALLSIHTLQLVSMPDPSTKPSHFSHGRAGILWDLGKLSLWPRVDFVWPGPGFEVGFAGCHIVLPRCGGVQDLCVVGTSRNHCRTGTCNQVLEEWCYKSSECGVPLSVLRFSHGVCIGTSVLSDNLSPHSQPLWGLALSRASFPT